MTLKFPFRNPAWSKKGAVATKELDRLNVMTGGSLVDGDDYVDTPAADDVETLGSLGRPGVISTALGSMDTTPVVWGQPSPKVSTDDAINRLIRSAALSFDDASPIPTTPVATTAFTTTATPRRCGSAMPQMKLPPTTITMCNTYPNEEVAIADYDQGKYLDRTSTKDTATMDSWSLQTASDCCHVGEEIQLANTLESKEDETLESKDDNKVDIVTYATTDKSSPVVVCVCDDDTIVADYDKFYDQGKEILYLGRTPIKDTAKIIDLCSSLTQTASDRCHAVGKVEYAEEDQNISTRLLETTSYATSATQTDLDKLTSLLRDRTRALEKVRALLEREQKQGKYIYIYMEFSFLFICFVYCT